jgi:diphthamide biosynthesis protein 2
VNALTIFLHLQLISCVSMYLVQVLYGLEYAHAIQNLKEALTEVIRSSNGNSSVHYAEVACSFIDPSESSNSEVEDNINGPQYNYCKREGFSSKYRLGGLSWCIPAAKNMEDYSVFWIGNDNSAFANVVLTFNNCEIG